MNLILKKNSKSLENKKKKNTGEIKLISNLIKNVLL